MAKVFEDYNFEEGSYSISFKRLRGSPNLEFEIFDKEVLKKLKEKWDFEESDSIGRCGYDYFIQLKNNGQVEITYLMCFHCKRLIQEKTKPWKVFEINPEFIQNYIDLILK